MQILQTEPTEQNLPNQTYQTKPTKPNQTKPNLPNQTHPTKPTKQKFLVKAVNAWVRSAFGNVCSLDHLNYGKTVVFCVIPPLGIILKTKYMFLVSSLFDEIFEEYAVIWIY